MTPGKSKQRRTKSSEQERLRLAIIDELHVLEEVLGALPALRRLTSRACHSLNALHGVLNESPEDEDTDLAGMQHELAGVEDALCEIIRYRLRVAATALQSLR